MSKDYRIVIPARLASQRLPGKPLLDIAGRTLLEHVYRQACRSEAAGIVVATDDRKIHDAAVAFGAEVMMTSPDHQSGSDRIAECADRLGWTDDQMIVNLQGDEPLMPPVCLDQVARILSRDPDADVASLYWPLNRAGEITDPNVVKAVVAPSGRALYFSRSVVPYPRNWADTGAALESGISWKRHIGLYAYRLGALRAFAAMQPTPLEAVEKLEQLRFLETGRRIQMEQACTFIPAGVDTHDDLERVRSILDG